MTPCHKCRFRKTVPGDCHIMCGKAFSANANPLAAALAILAGVGRVPAPGPTEAVAFRPKMNRGPGCGSWPSLFDESVIVECEGREEATNGNK